MNSCPHLVGIPRPSFDPNCATCVDVVGSHLREIIHHEDGRHTLIRVEGSELTIPLPSGEAPGQDAEA